MTFPAVYTKKKRNKMKNMGPNERDAVILSIKTLRKNRWLKMLMRGGGERGLNSYSPQTGEIAAGSECV